MIKSCPFGNNLRVLIKIHAIIEAMKLTSCNLSGVQSFDDSFLFDEADFLSEQNIPKYPNIINIHIPIIGMTLPIDTYPPIKYPSSTVKDEDIFSSSMMMIMKRG
jgi:hypothetical protein